MIVAIRPALLRFQRKSIDLLAYDIAAEFAHCHVNVMLPNQHKW